MVFSVEVLKAQVYMVFIYAPCVLSAGCCRDFACETARVYPVELSCFAIAGIYLNMCVEISRMVAYHFAIYSLLMPDLPVLIIRATVDYGGHSGGQQQLWDRDVAGIRSCQQQKG